MLCTCSKIEDLDIWARFRRALFVCHAEADYSQLEIIVLN